MLLGVWHILPSQGCGFNLTMLLQSQYRENCNPQYFSKRLGRVIQRARCWVVEPSSYGTVRWCFVLSTTHHDDK